MIADAVRPYLTTNIYIASPPSERELISEVRSHLKNSGFRVRTMHESEIAFRATYPNCDYLQEMFEGMGESISMYIIIYNNFFQMCFQQ